ncbi:MAG: type II and III secretion system protein family protein [Sedimentisphaerales bacterium]|nr:type II and III secretion system protein family protein [Sedimentisphaerales bacterium]
MVSTKEETKIWRHVAACLVILVLLSNFVHSEAPVGEADDAAAGQQTIKIIVGESTIVKSPWPTVRVAVTDPKIANVQVLTPDQVLLQGLQVGSTDLILWSEDESQTWKRRVKVNIDIGRFEAELAELFPTASLELSQSDDTLIIRGLLRKADHVTQLHDYLDKIGVKYVDMTSIAGIQQVQIQVRVAEVSRSALRTMGINAFHTSDDFFVASRPGSASGGALIPSIDIGPPSGTVAGNSTTYTFNSDVTAGSLVNLFAGFPNSDLEFFIQALAENQYLRVLANPTLVALSGEKAEFLVGGEYPIPVVQGGAGGSSSSVTIEYKEYGIRLMFEPTVLGDGTIRLKASQVVSDLTDVGSVAIGGFSIKALTTRKAETTLELNSGQTFAMAGLIKHNVGATTSGVPGLGDIPILGALFRSVRYSESETELVMLVTAELVEPMSLATTPPLPGFLHAAPSDWELYGKGHIESGEPAKIDPASAQWLQKAGLTELFGAGAWDSYGKDAPTSQAETTEKMEDAQK